MGRPSLDFHLFTGPYWRRSKIKAAGGGDLEHFAAKGHVPRPRADQGPLVLVSMNVIAESAALRLSDSGWFRNSLIAGRA